MAWYDRFRRYLQKMNPPKGPITTAELRCAEVTVLHYIQRSLPGGKVLNRLHPELSDEGLYRVSGTLDKSQLPHDAQHQIILAYGNPVAQLIIEDLV